VGPDGVTNALSQGLAAYTLQQNVLANDIANANTPNFQAQTVSFGRTLAGQLTATVTQAPGLMTANGNGVDVEAALVQLESNSTRLSGIDALLGGRVSATAQVLTNLQGA
jgi:flagellar basal body rod protein FlgB